MLKKCLWLAVLHVAINYSVVNAGGDREYVHIKVHMPEIMRKHNHHHKVLQKHHYHPQFAKQHYQQPKKLSPLVTHHQQQHVAEEFTFLPTPHLPILPEPELVSDDFESDDLMSTLHQQGDITTFPQPYSTAGSPPIIHQHTTQMPHLKQQLMKQLFTPEMMSAAMTAENEHFDGDTNSLMPDDFLAELQKEYVKKLQQKMQPERLLMHEKLAKKKKKYPDDSNDGGGGVGDGRYQQQRQHKKQPEQYYAQQQYNRNYNRNHFNNYEDIQQPTQQYHKLQQWYKQPIQQQQQHHHFDIETDDIMDNTGAAAFAGEDLDDDNSSVEEYGGGGGGTSYQDMYAAFTQPTAMQPSTTPTRLQQQWRQYHQQQQEQKEQFALPSIRLSSTPISLPPLSSSTTASSAATTLRNGYEQTFNKKRKSRIKPKRNRINVLEFK